MHTSATADKNLGGLGSHFAESNEEKDKDEEKIRVLEELGFSKNETKVYITLLKNGLLTATEIARNSAVPVHRVNVYDALGKLKERGLVNFVEKSGKTLFQAASPDNLIHFLREKELRLQKILPNLQTDQKYAESKSDVQIYESTDVVRNNMLHHLELKKDILIYGASAWSVKFIGKEFLAAFHERRKKQKQYMYHIYNSMATDRAKFLNTVPYTKTRYFLGEMDCNPYVCTTICGEEVTIEIWPETMDKKPLVLIIKNQRMADAYANYFWVLWEKAKEFTVLST